LSNAFAVSFRIIWLVIGLKFGHQQCFKLTGNRNMVRRCSLFDIEIVRILSILFMVGAIARIIMLARFTRKREDLGSVKASKPTGFVLLQVWLFLDILPLVFIFLGAALPSLIYGTPLNLVFSGAEYLQAVSVLLFFSGLVIMGASYRAAWQLNRPRIQMLEKQKLVTSGPYSRIRHPVYTGGMLMVLGLALLFLNIFPIVAFLATAGIAYRKAVLEEQLLASEDCFGQAYRDYMQKTGRFLPKL
jgi:protein-S-isoprenylcysteine O-methyltransferase Ste14